MIPFATSSSSGMGERTGTVIIDNRIFRDAGRVSCLFMCQKVFLNGTLNRKIFEPLILEKSVIVANSKSKINNCKNNHIDVF